MLARLKIVVGLFFRMYFDKLNCYMKRFCNFSNVKEQGVLLLQSYLQTFILARESKDLEWGSEPSLLSDS